MATNAVSVIFNVLSIINKWYRIKRGINEWYRITSWCTRIQPTNQRHQPTGQNGNSCCVKLCDVDQHYFNITKVEAPGQGVRQYL